MRSRLGLPERRLKMLMKIRSTRLYFLGNLIYFSCTTVSLTPVFQVLGHRQLHVSALGLAWPRSDSLSPARAGRCGMGVELLGGALRVPWCGQRPLGWHQAAVPCPRIVPHPPNSHRELPSAPHRGPVAKSAFFFQNKLRRVWCQGEGCKEPRRFIAEEILSPARADGRSRNNGRFAT